MTKPGEAKVELLPCPFCGSAASLLKHRQEGSGDSRTVHHVGCTNDGCAVRPRVYLGGPWGYPQKDDPASDDAAIQMAIAAWNTRVSPPPGDVSKEDRIDSLAHQLVEAMQGATGIFFIGNDNEWVVRVDKSGQAAGAAVPEGWKLVKISSRAERSFDADETGRYQQSCAACQRGFSGPKTQHLCRTCTQFPPVCHSLDVQRSREEALRIAGEMSAAPQRR